MAEVRVLDLHGCGEGLCAVVIGRAPNAQRLAWLIRHVEPNRVHFAGFRHFGEAHLGVDIDDLDVSVALEAREDAEIGHRVYSAACFL